MNNASTQNVWTGYRDGRRVMHYMVADNCRYYVQKTEAGYHVSQVFVAAESVHLMTAATLALGKRYAEEHANRGFVDVPLADLKAKVTEEPMYECEIPGTPGRITHGKPLEFAVSPGVVDVSALEWTVVGGTSVNDMPPGTYNATLVEPKGFESRNVQIIGRCKRIRPHRPATYKPHALGIDSFKVVRMDDVRGIEQFEQLLAQDARVCRIEQELAQYAGKRRTPNRDRKVAKLRKIMRILKRGVYE